MSCRRVTAGQAPVPLLVHLVRGGFTVDLRIPVDHAGPLTIEWSDSQGTVVATQDLALAGMTDDGSNLWVVALSQADTQALEVGKVTAARVCSAEQQILLAGRVQWSSGWGGDC